MYNLFFYVGRFMTTESPKDTKPKNIKTRGATHAVKANRANLFNSMVNSKLITGVCLIISFLSSLCLLVALMVILKVAQPHKETLVATINDSSHLVIGNIMDMTPTIRQTENFTQECFDIMYRATSTDFRSKQENLDSCFYPVFLDNNPDNFEKEFVNNFTSRNLFGAIQPILNHAKVVGSARTGDPVCLSRLESFGESIGIIGCYKVIVDMDLRFIFYGTNQYDDVSKKFEIYLDIVSRDVNTNGLVMYRMREING